MQGMEKRQLSTGMWIFILICVGVIVFSLCAGAAYGAVQRANESAAKANIGQIEAALLLAEKTAELQGLGQAPSSYSNMIKSYDDTGALTEYELYVQRSMMEFFGPARDFDFAVTRGEDIGGTNVEVYYFPQKDQTDTREDEYYHMENGIVTKG